MKKKKITDNPEFREQMKKTLIAEVLTFSPVFLGLLIMFIFAPHYKLRAGGIGMLIAEISGMIIAIRKESPRFVGSVKGNSAVINGVVFWLLTWAAGLYLLFGE
jgi:hypothetical protein